MSEDKLAHDASPWNRTLAFVREQRNRVQGAPRRLVSGVVWSLAGTASGRVFALLSSIVCARILLPDGFGRFVVIQTTATLCSAAAASGFTATVTRYLATYRNRDSRLAGALVGLAYLVTASGSGVMGIALFVGRDAISTRVLGDASLAPLMLAAAVLAGGIAFFNLAIAVLAGLERFNTIAACNALQGGVSLVCVFLGAMGGGVTGALWGAAVASVIVAVSAHLASLKALQRVGVDVIWRNRESASAALWSFSGASALMNFLILGTNWAATLLLVRSPAGYEEVSVFMIVLQLRTALMYVPATAALPMLAVLSDLHASDDWAAKKKLVESVLVITVTVSAAAALILSLMAPRILGAYGDYYASRAVVLIVMMLSVVPMALSATFGQLTASAARMQVGVVACIAWSLSLLTVAIMTYQQFGALGLAMAHAISYPIQMAVLAPSALQVSGHRKAALR